MYHKFVFFQTLFLKMNLYSCWLPEQTAFSMKFFHIYFLFLFLMEQEEFFCQNHILRTEYRCLYKQKKYWFPLRQYFAVMFKIYQKKSKYSIHKILKYYLTISFIICTNILNYWYFSFPNEKIWFFPIFFCFLLEKKKNSSFIILNEQ